MTVTSIGYIVSEQPYGAYFHGKVVDMFYFHFERKPPNWLPIWGGNDFTFNAIL
jgi:signal peptidase II